MRILEVTQTSREGGIQLPDLASVKHALQTYMSGQVPGSHETTRQGFGDDFSGAVGMLFKGSIERGGQSGFVDRLFSEIESGLGQRDVVRRSYDYDGVGPFMKTSVEVQRIEVGDPHPVRVWLRQYVYLLHLNAAYVGDQPCGELAKLLGADRALHGDSVRVALDAPNNRFEIDFADIANRLEKVPGLTRWTSEELVNHVMTEAAKGYDGNLSVTLRDDELKVAFRPAAYTFPGPFDRENSELIWNQTDTIISGPMELHGDKYSTPELSVTVTLPTPEGVSSYDRPPILDPTTKQAVHDQAAAIANAFS